MDPLEGHRGFRPPRFRQATTRQLTNTEVGDFRPSRVEPVEVPGVAPLTGRQAVDAYLRRTRGEQSERRGTWSLDDGKLRKPNVFKRFAWALQDRRWERQDRKRTDGNG